MRIRINHPKADTISVIDNHLAYASANTRELAFFWRGQWVVDPIPEFAQYHDGSESDSAVYPYVPTTLVDDFIAQYQH